MFVTCSIEEPQVHKEEREYMWLFMEFDPKFLQLPYFTMVEIPVLHRNPDHHRNPIKCY